MKTLNLLILSITLTTAACSNSDPVSENDKPDSGTETDTKIGTGTDTMSAQTDTKTNGIDTTPNQSSDTSPSTDTTPAQMTDTSPPTDTTPATDTALAKDTMPNSNDPYVVKRTPDTAVNYPSAEGTGVPLNFLVITSDDHVGIIGGVAYAIVSNACAAAGSIYVGTSAPNNLAGWTQPNSSKFFVKRFALLEDIESLNISRENAQVQFGDAVLIEDLTNIPARDKMLSDAAAKKVCQ